MLELYIDNKLCDLNGNERITIEIAVFDIKDITKRPSTRSIEFSLPKTVINSRVLEVSEEVTNLTRKPYRRLSARLVSDGIDLGISFCELTAVDNSYKVRLYGSGANFFNVIKDKKLIDLNLSQYDHIWNFSTVTGSRSNTGGYIYPVIDYGFEDNAMDNGGRVVKPDFMLPSVFVDTILSKVVSEAGYSFANSMQQDSEYIKYPLLMPATAKRSAVITPDKYNIKCSDTNTLTLNDYKLRIDLTDRVGSFTVGALVTQVTGSGTGSTGIVDSFGGGGAGYVILKNVVGEFILPGNIEQGSTTGEMGILTDEQTPNEAYYVPDNIIDYGGNWYSLPYALTTLSFEDKFPIKVVMKVKINNTETVSSTVRIFIKTLAMANKGIIATLSAPVGVTEFTVLANAGDTLLDVNAVPVVFELSDAPDNIIISAQVLSGASCFILPDTTLEVQSGFVGTHTNEFNYGARVQLSATLPEWTQAEFLKYYCQLYCLVPVVNEAYKTVLLRRFNEVQENQSGAIDGSGALDLSEPVQVEFKAEDFAQINNFLWAKDGDEAQPTGTNSTILIDSEILPLEQNTIELKTASTFSTIRLKDIPVPQIGCFVISAPHAEFKFPKMPRLLLLQQTALNTLSDTSDFTYYDGLGTLTLSGSAEVPLTRFIDANYQYNLGFENSLLPTYYSGLKGVLSDYKKVTALLRLNASDINTLDFFRPVYIGYFNAYFYINRIAQYTPGESTQVELVKIF